MPLNPSNRQRIMNALYPVALAETGDAHRARIVANYATTDMILVGRTLLLPMPEVNEALKSSAYHREHSATNRKAAA